MLDAMRNARLSMISILRRHDVAGLIVEDLFRGVEVWLVDEGLESSLLDGAALATRLCTPEGFAMTAGVLVPLDIELIEDAIADTPQLLRNRREKLIDDPLRDSVAGSNGRSFQHTHGSGFDFRRGQRPSS